MTEKANIEIYGNRDLRAGTLNRPLVTFALFAYNQAQYIREAVEGALSQTYSPLEIIVSDDCSSDKTFEIIREVALQYKGEHSLIIRRNKNNLGVSAHTNEVIAESHGQYLAFAAGDDVSYPTRIEHCMDAIITAARLIDNKSCYSVLTAARLIDEHGNDIGIINAPPTRKSFTSDINENKFKCYDLDDLLYGWTRTLGATRIMDKQTFELFGDIDRRCYGEDLIYMFRSLLIGKCLYVEVPCVSYRRHSENLSNIPNMYAGDFSSIERQIEADFLNAKSAGLIGADYEVPVKRWIEGRSVKRLLHRAKHQNTVIRIQHMRAIFMATDILKKKKIELLLSALANNLKVFLRNVRSYIKNSNNLHI